MRAPLKSGALATPRGVTVVEVEVEVQQFLFPDRPRAGVVEGELLEQVHGRVAVHERVQGDLQELALAAELDGRLHQGRADAPAAGVGADAEATDLADPL